MTQTDNKILDTLNEWKSCKERNEEIWGEDIEEPYLDVIDFAINFVQKFYLCTEMIECPQDVFPDGEGGIMFEYRKGNKFTAISINKGKLIQLLLFVNYKLVTTYVIKEIPV
jgi:hypothetical protein